MTKSRKAKSSKENIFDGTKYHNMVAKRARSLRTRRSSEIVDIVQLTFQEYQYRHNNIWSIIKQSLLLIITIMTLPYIFISDNMVNTYIWLFPILAIIVSIFAIIIVYSENMRMKATKEKLTLLLKQLSVGYTDINCKYYIKNKVGRKICSHSIACDLIPIMYMLFIITNVIFLYIILSGNFILIGA